MKTIEIIKPTSETERLRTATEQPLYDIELSRDFDNPDIGKHKAKKRAIILSRDRGEEYTARIKPEQPYESWTYEQGCWMAPKEHPDDDKTYEWDEDAKEWYEIDER